MKTSALYCFLLIIFMLACQNKTKTVKPIDISFTKEGELTLYKANTDSIINSLDIEIADTDYDTQTGLMYRSGMKDSQAMLFVFSGMMPRYFYMKNTQFPLDIIYIDNNFKIVSIVKNAKPMDDTSLPSKFPAQYVLETNAGLTDAWKLKTGDSIAYKSIK